MQLSENKVANVMTNQSPVPSSHDALKYEYANSDFEIVSKLARVETKIRDLEKRQRRDSNKAAIHHEKMRQLESKFSAFEAMASFKRQSEATVFVSSGFDASCGIG